MISVSQGDLVLLRDGRQVFVTDVATTEPPENIFVGKPTGAGMVVDEDAPNVVSDISEVVDVLNAHRDVS